MVFNTRACKFDPDVLTCKGAQNDSCLTSQQASAIKTAFAGPRNSRGDLVYPMNAYDAGIANLLPSPKPPANPPAANASAAPTSIDVDQRLFALLGDPLEALTDTTWINLSTFSTHGGSIALHTARCAATAYLAGVPAPIFQARLGSALRFQMRLAEFAADGLNNSLARAVLPFCLRVWPGVMGVTARLTRVAQHTTVDPQTVAA